MDGDGARALQTRMIEPSTSLAYPHAAGSRRDGDLPRLGRGSGGPRTRTSLNRPGSRSVALSIPLAGVDCLDVRSLHRLFKAIADRAGLPPGTSQVAYLQRHARQSCQERPATVRDCCANSTAERKGDKGLDDSGSGMPGRCRIAQRLPRATNGAIASHVSGTSLLGRCVLSRTVLQTRPCAYRWATPGALLPTFSRIAHRRIRKSAPNSLRPGGVAQP